MNIETFLERVVDLNNAMDGCDKDTLIKIFIEIREYAEKCRLWGFHNSRIYDNFKKAEEYDRLVLLSACLLKRGASLSAIETFYSGRNLSKFRT